MSFLRAMVVRAAAARKAAGAKVTARAFAVRDCAVARAVAVRSCAVSRAAVAWHGVCVLRHRVRMFFLDRAVKRLNRNIRRKKDKAAREQEAKIEELEYRTAMDDYRVARDEQLDLRFRDVYRKMQEQGKIPKDIEFPFPLREGLVKQELVVPVKPKWKAIKGGIQDAHDGLDLSEKAVDLLKSLYEGKSKVTVTIEASGDSGPF